MWIVAVANDCKEFGPTIFTTGNGWAAFEFFVRYHLMENNAVTVKRQHATYPDINVQVKYFDLPR